MATYDASQVRALALELKEKSLSLYADLLPIITTAGGWVLNSLDSVLPLPFTVRTQIEAYEGIAKSVLRLSEWITAIKQAQPGDTLTYPPPPIVGGLLAFDELSFETISF